MISFIHSTQRARSRLFDEQLSTAIDVLSGAEASSRLGLTGKLLIQECERAFLPNVRHGVARLPDEQKGSGNVAFVPLLRSDGEPGRLRISKALAAPSLSTVDTISQATGVDVSQHLRGLGGEPYRLNNDVPNAQTIAAYTIVGVNGNKRVATGRSVIVLADRKRGLAGTADTVAHEFQHAVDNRRLDFSPRILQDKAESMRDSAAREFRGYRVGYCVLDALDMYDDEVVGPMMEAWDEFNLGASAGWDVPDAAVERARSLGVL